MRKRLSAEDVETAILGGSVFACGGGGWAEHGRMLGREATAAGSPELVSIDELPDDAWIATAAAIGAPAGTTRWEMRGDDYVRAASLLQDALGASIAGFIVGQNGMSSTLNGWLPAIRLGAVVVDAVGDVRAHPTGDMGSLGLAGSIAPMIQTAAGGCRAEDRYIELVTRGATARVSPILRKAADMAGGFIASCRNPIRADYVRENAALGGISMALALGEAIRGAGSRADAVLDAICAATGGRILARGRVVRKDVRYTDEAFDIGTILVDDGGAGCVLHVMNEYMAVDGQGSERIATYPDVITTLDAAGNPVSVGHIEEGKEIIIFHVPASALPLSASVRDPSVYPPVERALNISIADYALAVSDRVAP